MTYILLAILFYFIYVFTIRFVIPIVRSTSQIKRRMQEMQSQQSDYARQRREGETSVHVNDALVADESSYADKGEYIEFEEIKEKQ